MALVFPEKYYIRGFITGRSVVNGRLCRTNSKTELCSRAIFVEFLQTARNQLFVPFLVLTTQKGVLFVAFHEFDEVAGYFPIVTM